MKLFTYTVLLLLQYLSSLAGTAATLLSTTPPLWIGGIPEDLVAPYVGVDISFESFIGCLSQFTFTDSRDILSSVISFASATYNR